MYGYSGYLLEVDLTLGKTRKVSLEEELVKKYIGGSGLGAALYCKYLSHSMEDDYSVNDFVERVVNNQYVDNPITVDAFSPNNPLIFMNGPLTGSTLPASNRMTVCSRSPHTNIWGEANSGGFFAPELRKAGYDGIIITGSSSKPVNLYIENDNIELISAEDVWGMDTIATIEKLSDHGKVMAIGPAGEKMSTMACIAVSTHNFLGRAGMGAVMGSKKLKAIVAKGSNKYQPAFPEKMKEIKSRLLGKMNSHLTIEALKGLGTNAGMDMGSLSGDVPTKNWQHGDWDKYEFINGAAFIDNFKVGAKTCFSCPVACKHVIKVDTDTYKMHGANPEYETAAVFGSNCLNDNAASIAVANDLCNRYGLDVIGTGSVIALAMDCFEKEYINTKDTDGMEIAWGDDEVIIELIHQIGQMKGFGVRLANGSLEFVKDLDPKALDLVVAVKGLEAPMHDPRCAWGLGLDYATSNRGACHVSSIVMHAEHGALIYPEIAIGTDIYMGTSQEGKVELVKKGQDIGGVFGGAAVFCYLGGVPFNGEDLVDSINAATGYDFTLDEIMQIGERIWCLKRTLNNLWGIRQSDDVLPKRLRTALEDGPTEGIAVEIDDLLKDYYKLRGLDKNGFVKREVLIRCGLLDTVKSNAAEAAAGQ